MAMTLGLLEANARWLLRFHAVTTGRWGPADLDIQQERYDHTLPPHVLYQPPKLPIGSHQPGQGMIRQNLGCR